MSPKEVLLGGTMGEGGHHELLVVLVIRVYLYYVYYMYFVFYVYFLGAPSKTT